MKTSHVVLVSLLGGALAACGYAASTSTQSTGVTSTASAATPRAPAQASRESSPLVSGAMLFVDHNDLRLGTTVQYGRIPTVAELHDLTFQVGLARVVLALGAWPEYEALQPLDQTPEGVELVAVLAGYPPSRAAADAWEHLRVPVRLIVVVGGPPPSAVEVADLNEMRGLDRVIARMSSPSRVGFERLQRPLSFWKVIE